MDHDFGPGFAGNGQPSGKRVILAFAGASGAIYGKTVFDELARLGYEIHAVFSRNAESIMETECGIGIGYFSAAGAVVHENGVIDSSIASGSFVTAGMAIVPASMGCVGRIASGVSTDLISRAADVILKERRRLVVVPRETPFGRIHLENLLRLHDAGAIVLPASPAFYDAPKTIDDLARFIAARVITHLGIQHGLGREYSPGGVHGHTGAGESAR